MNDAPFVTTLRTHGAPIVIDGAGATITIRVELSDLWDTVRVVTSPDEPVLAVKVRVLAAMAPNAEYHEDWVLKYRGWEILDENVSLTEAGIGDGAILLLAYRRRRPVR